MPVFWAAVIGLVPGRRVDLLRKVALAATTIVLAYAWSFLATFDTGAGTVQFFETHVWNPRLGSSFSLGLDGFSLPLVLLATLLTWVAVLASASIRTGAKLYFLLLLMLEAGMLGVFIARDWSLFYVFWEATLIPLFFLIERLGGKNRQQAALNFVLYTMGGSVFMLVALLLLYDGAPGHSFDMGAMAQGARSLPLATQMFIFAGLFIGFAVKMPVVPLHGWLPLAHVEAPSPVSILLSGVLLKMGAYGLIRATEALPDAVAALQNWLATLAFVSLLYGGVLAWRQRDLKSMVAYSSIAHMGVVLLGIAALNVAGLTGAIMQMVAHGLVAGLLFLLIGLLYERTHTRDIADYESLITLMPRFAFFTVLGLVAAIGLPGTAGFVAELQTLIGGFARWGGWVALLSLSVLVSAAYAVRTIGRLCTGPTSAAMCNVPDISRSELAAAAVLAVGIIALGFFPAPALALVGATVGHVSRLFGT